MSSHAEGKKGICHTDIIYTVKTSEVRGEQPRNYFQWQNGTTMNMRDPFAHGQQKTADCTGLPTLAQSIHWHRHKGTQQNTRE